METVTIKEEKVGHLLNIFRGSRRHRPHRMNVALCAITFEGEDATPTHQLHDKVIVHLLFN